MLIKQEILALSRNLARLGINSGAIDVIMNRSLLEENNFLNCFDYLSSLNLIGTLTLSVLHLQTTSKKIEASFYSMKYFSFEVALYLFKSTIWPCMEYCFNVWVGAPRCYWDTLNKLQERVP